MARAGLGTADAATASAVAVAVAAVALATAMAVAAMVAAMVAAAEAVLTPVSVAVPADMQEASLALLLFSQVARQYQETAHPTPRAAALVEVVASARI